MKAFRARFRKASVASAEGLNYEPLPDELLARYILSRNHFNSSRAKPLAFEPPKDLRLSVFRIFGLGEPQIWDLGYRHVAEPSNRTLYARADFSVSLVNRLALNVHRSDSPPRHADIVGWPSSKNERMSIAQQLAAESSLSFAPKATP